MIYNGDGKSVAINKSVTIMGTGDGARLNALDKSQIFEISADDVVVENLIFAKGIGSKNGGAIYRFCNNNFR